MPTTNSTMIYPGRHWETGTLANLLLAQGTKAPHTNQPPSEALLMGVSGGANFGYFTFAYPGYLPFAVLLTRNTFDPLQTIYERLGWRHEVVGTVDPEKGLLNLQKAIDDGYVPMVIADTHSMKHHSVEHDPNNWSPMPMLVTKIEGEMAWVVDRSLHPWPVPVSELTSARSRIKDLKNKVFRFDAPAWDLLPSAVEAGIRQTISLFTEDPPKGAKDRFGFLGFAFWGELLTNQRNKQSWERYFGNGYGHFHALAGSHIQPGLWTWITCAGSGDGAERDVYADFLEEASVILNRDALKEVAGLFRLSAGAWRRLADKMLPDTIPAFAQARRLHLERSRLWFEEGHRQLAKVRELEAELEDIRAAIKADFPLDESEVRRHRAEIADALGEVAGVERTAVQALMEAMR
ncbi:MAG: DUF4872 domain-containing protein [Fimbriimonadaceae bacterium]|nr:DUF4872 domain-containing protein [Fimbriimonadaceae bacterium]